MPGNFSEYGIMGSSGEDDGDLIFLEPYFPFSFDKESVNLGGIASFKSAELLGQHAVEGISNHGHNYVEMDLYQDGGRKGVEVEKFDSLRDDIFHPPSSGVIANQQLQWRFEVIRDQEGGLFMAVSPDDYLAQVALVIRQCDERFMYQRIGILPFGMGNMNALPGFNLLDPTEHVLASPPESNKAYPLLVEGRELRIGSELGVKDKDRFDPPFDLFPEGEKAHYLIVGLPAFDVSGRVKNEFGCSILSKKSQCPFHSLAPGSGPVLLQNGFFPKVGDGMEVQVDDIAIVELELTGVLDKALLQAEHVNRVKAVGIGGYGSALGQNIELSKEPRPRIEGMLGDMGIALGAEQLKGHKREKIADCWDHLGSGQSGLLHHLEQIELFDEGGKEEYPGSLRVKGLLRNITEPDPLSHRRHLGTLDRHSQFQPCPTGQSRVALFCQDPFNRTYGNLHSFFGQELSDLSGRQAMFSPIADFGPGSGIDAMPSGLSRRHGFGEVDLFLSEQMSEEIDVRHRISEAVGDHLGGQAINKGGSQGLIASLPLMHGMEEEFFVAHGSFIYYDAYNVKSKMYKMEQKPSPCKWIEKEKRRKKAYHQASLRFAPFN